MTKSTPPPTTPRSKKKAAATRQADVEKPTAAASRKKAARKRTPPSNAAAEPSTESSTESSTGPSAGPSTAPGRAIPEFPEFPDLVDVGDFIRQQREKMEMSVRRLSELAGVSNPYLSQIERGLRNPSADILQQVANALRISVETLYVRAGILPDQDRSVSTVPEAIEHDRDLNDDQKAALLNVYQSFVSPR